MATREEITKLMQGDEFEDLRELLQMGEESVPILIDIMKDTSAPAFLRHRATVALGEVGPPTAAPDIRATLADADPVQRIMAARALVKTAGTNATDALVPLLSDPDPSVSKVAIQSLAQVGDQRALAALKRIENEGGDDFLRAQAKAAIKNIQERNP
jgi:HEAT repeat protein